MPPEQGSADAGQGQGTPDGGQGQGAPAPDPKQGAPDGGQQQGSDESAATIARLNAEAKQHRERAEAAEAKLKEHERQGMSDLEKAQAAQAEEERKRIDLEKENQELKLSGAVRAAAEKAKAVDPDVIWRMIDLAKVETDGAGKPTNMDALVADVKKAHPALFVTTKGDGDGGARGGTSPSGDMNELIRRGARRGAPA